jgi:hypothetical protein
MLNSLDLDSRGRKMAKMGSATKTAVGGLSVLGVASFLFNLPSVPDSASTWKTWLTNPAPAWVIPAAVLLLLAALIWDRRAKPDENEEAVSPKLASELQLLATQRREQVETAKAHAASAEAAKAALETELRDVTEKLTKATEVNEGWKRRLEFVNEQLSQSKGLAEQWSHERNQANEELATIRTQKQEVDEQLADVRRLLKDEGTILRDALDRRREQSRNWCWQARYGMEYPSNIPDRLDDLAGWQSMRGPLEIHIAVCKQAADSAASVLSWILGNLGLHNQTEPAYLALFVDEHVHKPLQVVVALLEESRDDPRAALATFYQRYQSARHAIGYTLPLVPRAVNADGVDEWMATAMSYGEWSQADAALLADIRKLREVSYMKSTMKYLPGGLFMLVPLPIRPSPPSALHSGEQPSAGPA